MLGGDAARSFRRSFSRSGKSDFWAGLVRFASRSAAVFPEPQGDRRHRLPAWLKAAVPLAAQLEQYSPRWLVRDAVAGLAIAAVALPTAVAYPEIAGLPPAVGLYASILPLIVYAIFGSSRQLIVGPDAVTLALLGASLSQFCRRVPMSRRSSS